MSTCADLSKRLRTSQGWSQEELAGRLMVSRNYISLIESGKKEASLRLLTSLERLAADVEKEGTGLAAPARRSASIGVLHDEVQAPYGSPAQIRAEIKRHVEALLAAAGDDHKRLGWIAEQLQSHAAVPAHWKRGPLVVPVVTPSQTQDLSSETGLPIPRREPRAHSA